MTWTRGWRRVRHRSVGARVALGAEQQHRPSRWSSRPPAVPITRIRAGLERDRGVERELEVGRVLRGRMPLDRARRPPLRQRARRRDRVEVADRTVDAQPERERAVETAVGRDHVGAPAEGRPGPAVGSPPATTTITSSFSTRLPPWALPRSGSAGRRCVAALSARSCPSSPLRCRHPSLPAGQGESESSSSRAFAPRRDVALGLVDRERCGGGITCLERLAGRARACGRCHSFQRRCAVRTCRWWRRA